MDFKQRKLTKSEWESIEVPVSADEIEILNLINDGYSNVNIKYNKTNSLFTFLKIEYSESIEDYLYNKYFAEKLNELIKKYKADYIQIKVNTTITIKKAEIIRMQKNTIETLKTSNIYENLLIEHVEQILKYKNTNNSKWQFHYFTLYKLSKFNIVKINRHILDIVKKLLDELEEYINIPNIIENAVKYIEKNQDLLSHSDMTLYEHQKEVFTISKTIGPKLVLYIAPTGTGKTLSPIGLSQSHRIIFVCAARHVGLALAKAAISVNKKVAFAFGCASSEEIRLHYFSAKEYTKNWKSGGIWKVDNTIGDKVEIMICDIKSYLPAMYYMLSFNNKENIITYWDEPTITLDYPTHEFHEIIQKNWSENLIPNMILSSATLPKLHELPDTTNDFIAKFPGAQIHNVISHDCKKSIPILNKDGYVILPHNMDENYENILQIVSHCENYLTLLRYFDLNEVVKFITYVNSTTFIQNTAKIQRHFGSLDEVNMINIKLYYLKLLKNIKQGTWGAIYITIKSMRQKKIPTNDYIDATGNPLRKTSSIGPGVQLPSINKNTNIMNALDGKSIVRTHSVFDNISSANTSANRCTNGSNSMSVTNVSSVTSAVTSNTNTNTGNFAVYMTTKDAYTLTDGPTIYLASNVEKIAKFCIQQANIPVKVMDDILEKIEFNNTVNDRIARLEHDKEDLIQKTMDETGKSESGDKKNKKLDRITEKVDTSKIQTELNTLYSLIKVANLNETFSPNKHSHLKKWAEPLNIKNAFTSDIDETIITKIMLLNNVENSWKVLLLMGIGVFTNHENIDYTEIMKELANQQKLYMIIASSDYIYGTNYQFCHGYLSKDMDLTQEKIIQAIGRIGRNKIQQDYTVRFRDDEQIIKLFTENADKPEIMNMNRLFNSCAF